MKNNLKPDEVFDIGKALIFHIYWTIQINLLNCIK